MPTVSQHTYDETLKINASLPYTLFTPKVTPAPLIIYLHGAGERGTDPTNLRQYGPNTYIRQQGDDFPFFVASPQCPLDEFWTTQLTQLEGFFAFLKVTLPIDTHRVYLTGNSMGGYGTWYWSIARPAHFAAIAPICGGGVPWTARRLKDVPVWAFHGDADDVVQVGESVRMVDAVNAHSGSATLTVYEGVAHDSWSQTYLNSELYDWLRSHAQNGV